MIVYVDTSVLVPLLVHEQGSDQARTIVSAARTQTLVLSDWAVTELASALAFKRRLGAIEQEPAEIAFSRARDALASGLFEREALRRDDFEQAADLMMSKSLAVRAGDALHLAVCLRLRADLATFDFDLIAAAQALGVRVNP